MNRPPAKKTAKPPKAPAGAAAVTVQQSHFQGPIPPPALLEGYERLVPGAAERILAMAEKEASHIRDMDRKALSESAAELKRGQYLGFGVALAALGASVATAAMGYPAVAGVIGGTTVVGLVTVFVVGRRAGP